jgi:holliday junction DNA helicase RuvA
VATEDLVALTKVPGVGKKSAQRIVIELKDKLGPPATPLRAAPVAGAAITDGWRGQVHAALLGLGWSGREADAALEQVAPLVGDGVDGADVPGLLRAALRTLARP